MADPDAIGVPICAAFKLVIAFAAIKNIGPIKARQVIVPAQPIDGIVTAAVIGAVAIDRLTAVGPDRIGRDAGQIDRGTVGKFQQFYRVTLGKRVVDPGRSAGP